jgi:hypothetical protein
VLMGIGKVMRSGGEGCCYERFKADFSKSSSMQSQCLILKFKARWMSF